MHVQAQGGSKMSSPALLQALKESILTQANVKAVYGEPIVAQGKTVVPVAVRSRFRLSSSKNMLVVSDAPSSYQREERQAQCGECRFHSLPRLSEFLRFETGEQMRTTDKAERFSRFPNLFHL